MYKQLEIQQYLLYTITQVHNLVKTIIQAILYIKRKHYSFSHDFFLFEVMIHHHQSFPL